jgi:hypothetical protein
VGSTWDALRRAEQDRNEALSAQQGALEQLGEDIAALRVTVHSLEDRVELEIGGLSDDLRQAIAKAGSLPTSRDGAADATIVQQLGALSDAAARGERRLNAIAALLVLATLLTLFRC